MKLYMTDTSGNAYKVRLLLSMLSVPYEKALIDARSGEHKKEPYLKINPRGQVPALEDGGRVFWGSTACLIYVARKHGGDKWLPTDPAGMAEVAQWLELVVRTDPAQVRRLKVAHVKLRGLQDVEYCELYARAHGIDARVFVDEAAAERWLREA